MGISLETWIYLGLIGLLGYDKFPNSTRDSGD